MGTSIKFYGHAFLNASHVALWGKWARHITDPIELTSHGAAASTITKLWVGGQDSKAECDIQMLLVADKGLTYTSGFSRAKSWGTEVFQLTGVGQGGIKEVSSCRKHIQKIPTVSLSTKNENRADIIKKHASVGLRPRGS